MPTLYVENVPQELYDALRQRAKEDRKSISAEVLTLLERNIPTASELRRRRKLLDSFRKLQAATSPVPGPHPSSLDMLREDRER